MTSQTPVRSRQCVGSASIGDGDCLNALQSPRDFANNAPRANVLHGSCSLPAKFNRGCTYTDGGLVVDDQSYWLQMTSHMGMHNGGKAYSSQNSVAVAEVKRLPPHLMMTSATSYSQCRPKNSELLCLPRHQCCYSVCATAAVQRRYWPHTTS